MGIVTGRNIVLTGIPRGGTTLACKLLEGCVDTVALFEPMDVNALPPRDRPAAIATICDFFDQVRARALHDSVVPSKQVDGLLPDNLFAKPDPAGHRAMLAKPGFIALDPRPAPGFTLVIKQNAAFTALLPELASAFRAIAVVRHPLAVLASWNSIYLPVSHGRLPAGERLDPDLAAELDAESDLLARQLCVIEWFFSRFDRFLPASQVLRYEEMIASRGESLRACAGVHGGPVAELAERNANRACDPDLVRRAANALLERGGSWERWYPRPDMPAAARRILDTREA